ncbi:hypothetical protein BKA57DRAFT_438888 [Linnemannia elongata]|nr:hypothetical protein BKA57DRAFT_438888 [Linnemannia elongata]
MILDDLPTPFSIHNNNDHNTARTQPHLQEGSLTNTALSPAKATSSSKNNLSEDVAAPFNTSSTSTALPNSHQQQPQLQQQQESTLGSGVANKSAPLVLPIERTSILTLESILTTPSTQSNSPSGSIVMTMAGEATTFFDDMMEDICSSSTSVLTTSTSASGTISASTTIHTSTSATTTTAAIPISSSSGIKALLQQHQQQQQQQTSATTNTTTTIVGGFLTPSPTQSLPELYHDFFDPIRAGTGGAEQRYDDSDQSMSDAEMEMEMDLDMMEDAPTVRARLAEMRRALETVVW